MFVSAIWLNKNKLVNNKFYCINHTIHQCNNNKSFMRYIHQLMLQSRLVIDETILQSTKYVSFYLSDDGFRCAVVRTVCHRSPLEVYWLAIASPWLRGFSIGFKTSEQSDQSIRRPYFVPILDKCFVVTFTEREGALSCMQIILLRLPMFFSCTMVLSCPSDNLSRLW